MYKNSDKINNYKKYFSSLKIMNSLSSSYNKNLNVEYNSSSQVIKKKILIQINVESKIFLVPLKFHKKNCYMHKMPK